MAKTTAPAPGTDAGHAESSWHEETILKADVFSRISVGQLRNGEKAILRDLTARKWWAAPLSAHFARREARSLAKLAGIAGVPALLAWNKGKIYREWIPGVPLHVAQPFGDTAFFAEARAILRQLRRLGVTHNDLAKEPNWLRGQDGRPWLLDFQLASIHARKGLIYRVMAYEDLRHLLKHKRTYCPDAMTARESALLARRSLPSRIWRKTGKKVYTLVTRGLFNWSDGEGSADRLKRHGERLSAELRAHPAVSEVALTSYPHPRMVEGLYAFVRADGTSGEDLAAWSRKKLGPEAGADLVQVVEELPRDGDGRPRMDLLKLVAQNLLDEVRARSGSAEMAALMGRIIAGRLNLTDRPVSGAGRGAAE